MSPGPGGVRTDGGAAGAHVVPVGMRGRGSRGRVLAEGGAKAGLQQGVAGGVGRVCGLGKKGG